MMKESINKAVMVVIAAITIFVLGLLLLGRFTQMRIQDMQQDKLVLERDLGADLIEKEFLVVETFLLDIERYVTVHNDDNDLLDYLISIDQDHEFVYSVYLGYTDKTMINSSGFIPPATFDLTTRSWYQNALMSNDIVYTNVFLNATQDRLIITLSHAIYDESNQLIGVVGADVDLQMITQTITGNTNEDYYAFLVDNEGFVLSHPSKNTDSLDLVSIDEFGIGLDLFGDQYDLIEQVTFDDEEGIIAYRLLDGSNYYYGIYMESSFYNQTLTLFGIGLVSFVTLGIIIAALIVIGFQLFIVKPTNSLIRDIELIDVTKEEPLSLPINKGDGFISTRKAVNHLLKLNDTYKHKLSDSNTEMLMGLQRFDLLLSSASDIVFELDQNGFYQKVYGKCMELFGIDAKEMVGKSFKEVFHSLNIDDRKEMYDDVLNGNSVSYNWMYEYNETVRYLQTNLSPLYDENEHIKGIVGVTRDVSEVQNQYEELLYISTHDYLTDLYNRRVILEEMDQLERSKKYPYTIVNIDLNGLKLINDALGHQVGDLALQRTAEVLKKNTWKRYRRSCWGR